MHTLSRSLITSLKQKLISNSTPLTSFGRSARHWHRRPACRCLILPADSPLDPLRTCTNQMKEIGTDSNRNPQQQLNFIQRIRKDGASEWVVASEDYDYNQEIARAAYADMLHDHNRNIRYYDAIKLAVQQRHAANEKAIVLDIGTGTGLLSMMALAAGADSVFACEAFKPMAVCADKVLRRNGYRDRVQLIPKRSTELEVGEGKDLPRRVNILVAEVFDTGEIVLISELIGEGAIEVFNHAKKELTTEDCSVIPARGKVFAQVVSWPLLNKWNKLEDFSANDSAGGFKYPDDENTRNCPGVPSVHDLQLTEAKDFTSLSEEIVIFEFDWNKIEPLSQKNSIPFQALHGAESRGVFLWWDLIMYEGASATAEENVITCRPNWSGNFHWRDHWMQAVYYLPSEFPLEKGGGYSLECAHDEFSFWFRINSTSDPTSAKAIEPKHPVCKCGIHLSFSRSRFGLLNDEKRRTKYYNCLKRMVKPNESVVLVISDGSYLGLMAARLNAKKVFILESDPSTAKLTRSFLELNGLQENAKVLQKSYSELKPEDFDNLTINIVVGEPYFQTPAQPWNHVTRWCEAISTLSWAFPCDVKIEPSSAQIKCVAMEFEHLWKINATVGTVCGFDLTDFDELIEKSSEFADTLIDSQPLWEYPGTVCSEEIVLESINFQTDDSNPATLPQLETKGTPNGLALWMEYKIGGETVSTGFDPDSKPGSLIGKKLDWDPNWKQGVYLFRGKPVQDLGKWWQTAKL